MFIEFEDFIFNCESKGLSLKTIKGYRNVTALFLKHMKEDFDVDDVSKIKHIHVKKYLKSKNDSGCTNLYINGIIKVLKVFFSFCVEEEYFITNPLDKVSRLRNEQKIIENFSDEEVKKMVNAYGFNNYLDARNKAILATFFDTGIRTTECINIVHEDVKKDRIYILGKGNKERFVPVSFPLRRILNRYESMKDIYFKHKKQRIDNNYFLSRTGRVLTVEAMEWIFKKTGKKVGVREEIRCTGHTARHTYAISMLKNHDIYTVSKLLGHSSVKITERYLRALTNEKILDNAQFNSPLMTLKRGNR